MQTNDATVFTDHRDRLVGAAYRITGSTADAEDVVQEAWLRWSRVDTTDVRDPLAFLIRTVTRLALDRLRRITARRETYPGEWLPEPLVTGRSVEDDVVRSEAVSMAMLRLLETLSPLERAVFVLREAFDLPHAEIGAILDRSESTIRQLAKRARAHVEAGRPRFDTDPKTRREVTDRFLAATRTGDLEALMAVLSPGVTLIADSGGKVKAPRLPITGPDKVGRFLVTVAGRELPAVTIDGVGINGGPGVVVSRDGVVEAVLAFELSDGAIDAIYLVGNPDKLARMSRIDGGAASSR